jgi:hypothetical protein
MIARAQKLELRVIDLAQTIEKLLVMLTIVLTEQLSDNLSLRRIQCRILCTAAHCHLTAEQA